jgi:lysophospholipid acyltransferase (LPLAT)-like uncharacterized protein
MSHSIHFTSKTTVKAFESKLDFIVAFWFSTFVMSFPVFLDSTRFVYVAIRKKRFSDEKVQPSHKKHQKTEFVTMNVKA